MNRLNRKVMIHRLTAARRFLMRALWLLPFLAAVVDLRAATNFPVVNVSVLSNSVPEGSLGYFIFTSDQRQI
jgi:hypothetical protein